MKQISFIAVVLCWVDACTVTNTISKYRTTCYPNDQSILEVATETTSAGKSQLNVFLRNNSPDLITINWDKSFLVLDGETHRVTHRGVRYIERDAPQAITPIGPLTDLKECLIPTEHVEFIASNWVITDLPNSGQYSIVYDHKGIEKYASGTFKIESTTEKTKVTKPASAAAYIFIISLLYLAVRSL